VLRRLCGGQELRGGHYSKVGAPTGSKLVARDTSRVRVERVEWVICPFSCYAPLAFPRKEGGPRPVRAHRPRASIRPGESRCGPALDVIGPSGIAGQLARMPDVVARLLAEHVPDRKGRCRGCGLPGTGTPHVPAPCALWLVAEAASRIGRLDQDRVPRLVPGVPGRDHAGATAPSSTSARTWRS
jgi:hypothetical protein